MQPMKWQAHIPRLHERRFGKSSQVVRISHHLPKLSSRCHYAFAADARADPTLPSHPPLHFFTGAVKRANCGSDNIDNDGDNVRSLNLQGEADFLFCRLPPLQRDTKLGGGAFSLESDSLQTSNSFYSSALSGGVMVGQEQSRQSCRIVFPFLHCTTRYLPWDFNWPHGQSHCFDFA